jgi:hypothetical protein
MQYLAIFWPGSQQILSKFKKICWVSNKVCRYCWDRNDEISYFLPQETSATCGGLRVERKKSLQRRKRFEEL